MVWNVDGLLKELGIDYSYEKSENEENSITVNGIAPLNNASPQNLAFCSDVGDEAVMSISKSRAGVIFCKKSVELLLSPIQKKRQQQCLIFLENPRLTVMRIIKFDLQRTKKGINWSFA